MTESPVASAPVSSLVPVRDGVRLRMLRWSEPASGDASAPIVLVHGLASNARLWDGAARAIAARGHGVVALDLRGHGLSDKPDHGYDLHDVADDIVDVIRTIAHSDGRWTRPLVVGQSWGGNLVMSIAARHGDAVRGVVAVDGGTIDLASAFDSWETCKRTLSPPALEGMPAARLRSYIRAAHPDWSEEAIDGQMHNMEHREDGTIKPWLTLERHLAILRGMWDAPPSTLWPAISVPVLFTPAAKGDDDHARAKQAQLELASSVLPSCAVEWFEPADHDLHAQFPDRFAESIHQRLVGGFFP